MASLNIEQIVQLQVEAIRNIKIDKVVVWDGSGAGEGGTATANFLAGIELPKYLGHRVEGKGPEPQ